MFRTLTLLTLLLIPAYAQQVNTDVIPASSGLNLGHSNQRWNLFAQNVDIQGTCTLNGVNCFGANVPTIQTNGVTVANTSLINFLDSISCSWTNPSDGQVTVTCTGGGGTPGGSDKQLQTNNASSFGGITNVAPGSVLASQGASAFPAFQTKNVVDVRDYGVVGNGVTDDTTAFQNAVNAACSAAPAFSSQLIAPARANFVIKVTATINFTKCWGFTLNFGASQGEVTPSGTTTGTAGFLWAGSAGGTVLSINQNRDSTYESFYINSANADVPILIDSIAPVTSLTSGNQFRDISIRRTNASSSATFVGINICPTAPGNCDFMTFKHVRIWCSNGSQIPDATNFGIGVWQQGPGGAEPNDNYYEDVEMAYCSKGFLIDSGIVVDIAHSKSGQNYTDLYLDSAYLVKYHDTRDESSSLPIIINGSGNVVDFTLDHVSFSGVRVGPVISFTAGSAGTRVTLSHNNFSDSGIVPIVGPGSNTIATLDSDNNVYPTTHCPDWTTFSQSASRNDNCNSPDNLSRSRTQQNQSLQLTRTNYGGGNNGSWPLVLWGNKSAANDDATYITHQLLLGTNESYLAFSHKGANTLYGVTLPPVLGGTSFSTLTVTPAAPAISNVGTPGLTTYTYVVVANDGAGNHSAASGNGTTSTGNATLDTNNYNRIQWNERSGAYSYTVYRTVGGATQGVIGTVVASDYSINFTPTNPVSGYFFNDTGLAGDSTSAPATNTTGNSSWTNAIAATSGTAQSSPTLTLGGQYWNGSASAADTWTIQDVIANGTNGASNLTFAHSGSAATWNRVTVPQLTTNVNGSVVNAPIGFGNSQNIGFYYSGGINATSSGNDVCGFQTGAFACASGVVAAWSSTTAITGAKDTGISRDGAGVLDLGNGTQANTTAKLQASGYISKGTKFTTNNGCSDSATAGGATAGTFTVGSTSCTEVVTMGDSATAPNGWSCTVIDITTLADVTNPHQTTSNATTATFVTGTVVSGDKIQFSCIGY